ncbi:MAG: VOC family protein [Actinomycetota bacterium]
MDRAERPVVECVMVDAVDPERLATFWTELLGLTVTHRTGPYVFVAAGGGLPGLGFQRVDVAKTVKNRIHLDIAADDPARAVNRVLALGGSRVPGYDEGGFLVMADPEGNEFCVLPAGDWELDNDGIAHSPHPSA